MNCVFIVPTGIGAEIGGHSGDATPAAKLIASVCDKLFIHPNVVNASDINEMTENMLYVEGSMLDRFLEGGIRLQEVYMNKILLAINEQTSDIVNAVNAARVTIGADIEIVELKKPLGMTADVINGIATGDIFNLNSLLWQISGKKFDVLVINTPIVVDDEKVKDYLRSDGGVNLWGGVEAKLSKQASNYLNKPVIHAPVENNSEVFKNFKEVVDPRKAAEMVSTCYLHCCLKGAHKAPKISLNDNAYRNFHIDFLISPIGTYGRPHIACSRAGIPIIYVKENKTVCMENSTEGSVIVENYLEVVGVICAKKAGVVLNSVRRPLVKQ